MPHFSRILYKLRTSKRTHYGLSLHKSGFIGLPSNRQEGESSMELILFTVAIYFTLHRVEKIIIAAKKK